MEIQQPDDSFLEKSVLKKVIPKILNRNICWKL